MTGPRNHLIREGVEGDIEAICSFVRKRAFIERAVAAGDCSVAVEGDRAVACGVMNHSFFGQGFVSFLEVHTGYRRQGVGLALMQHMESLSATEKFFTSTNLSNVSMQSLLAKLGYKLSGVIDNLDEGDPELVYFKRLSARASGL